MYNLDKESLYSELSELFRELKNSKGYLYLLKKFLIIFYILLVKYSRIILIKYLLKNKNISLLVSSKSRMDLLKKKFPNTKIYFIRNCILKNNLIKNDKSRIKINSLIKKEFILLSGNINNFEDFQLLTKFCKKNNLILVHCGFVDKDIKDKLENFNEIIKFLGYIDYSIIIKILIKAKAVAVFYKKNTINQEYSASSKLLEAIYLSKKIILSRNPGALNELNNFSYKNFHFIEELSKVSFKNLDKIKNQTSNKSKECFFENECVRLSKTDLLKI